MSHLQRALELNTPAVMVRVVATRGSAPRQSGTAMLVGANTVSGTVGGGHLEYAAIALARSAQDFPFEKEYPLGAALGQCCGGAMTLRFEALSTQHLIGLQEQCAAFKTLYLFGAGHVACAIQAAVAALPLRLSWIDSRDDVNTYQTTFPSGLPEHVETLICDAPEGELKQAKEGDMVLIMTHSHALDEVLVSAALRMPQLAYIGLIGSATKRRLFEQRLVQRGFANDDFARLTCPIGSPRDENAHSKLPAVIALQVAAQLCKYL